VDISSMSMKSSGGKNGSNSGSMGVHIGMAVRQQYGGTWYSGAVTSAVLVGGTRKWRVTWAGDAEDDVNHAASAVLEGHR
jgi:hypothetical protein